MDMEIDRIQWFEQRQRRAFAELAAAVKRATAGGGSP